MDWQTAILAGCISYRKAIGRSVVLLLILLASCTHAHAAVVVTPRISFIVFADRHMPDDEWSALFADLRRDMTSMALETHLYPYNVDLIRGDTLVPGMQFEETVSIYLHGDCRLLNQPNQHVVQGTLGWVLRDHGTIEPFIHVDCTRIGEILGQRALGMDQDRRNSVMAEAISRVVLHEWVHVATQSAAHKGDGIFKSTMGLADLMPGYDEPGGRVSQGK